MVAHGIAARKAKLHAVEWTGDALAANVCSIDAAGARLRMRGSLPRYRR